MIGLFLCFFFLRNTEFQTSVRMRPHCVGAWSRVTVTLWRPRCAGERAGPARRTTRSSGATSTSRTSTRYMTQQESPPAWTQEAYRPQEGARCWPPPAGWTDWPPPAGVTWPPPPAGVTWPPLRLEWPDPPPCRLDWLTPPPPAGVTWPCPPGWSDLTPPPPPRCEQGGKKTEGFHVIQCDSIFYTIVRRICWRHHEEVSRSTKPQARWIWTPLCGVFLTFLLLLLLGQLD